MSPAMFLIRGGTIFAFLLYASWSFQKEKEFEEEQENRRRREEERAGIRGGMNPKNETAS